MLMRDNQAIQTVAADWPWRTVRAAILQRGLSLSDLASSAGYAPASGRCVAREPLPRLQAEIAMALGYSPLAIWPSRYADDGRPLSKREWLERKASVQAQETIVLPVVIP